MKRCLLFLCCLLGAGAGCLTDARSQVIVTKRITKVLAPFAGVISGQPAPAPADVPSIAPTPAILRWNNGETASGEVIAATATDLTWKTPLFEDPLLLDWRALHRIDHALPGIAPTEPFHFVMRDGSHLYGDLVGITADTVTVHSARCGDVVLRRSEMLTARRIKGDQLVYAGPLGDSGWVTAPDEPTRNNRSKGMATLGNVPTQLTGPGGALELPFWRRTTFLKLALPPRVDVEFCVRANELPAFRVALAGGGSQGLRVETWGDELVLTAASFYQSIRRLDPGEREIALRVCWDQPARRCEVYTPEGRLLAQCAVPEDSAGGAPGVSLQNKGRALSLDTLTARAWDGQPPPAVEPGQPRVELDGGRVVAGTVSGAEAGAVLVGAVGDGPPASFPLGSVDAIIFSSAAPAANPTGATLTYADGTFLRGDVAGITDGIVSLTTTFTATPLCAQTDALRRLFLPGSDPQAVPALKALDKLVASGTTLHGRLDTTVGDAFPRWTPVGGERPALPSKTLPVEMTRHIDPQVDTPGAGALFYTRLGDALPGTLHGLDREELNFDCPLVETKKLPAGEWQAVQFNVSARGSIQGFDAPDWQISRKSGEKIRPSGDALTLPEGSKAAHPAAMLDGEIKFSYDTTNFSFVRLRMFCDGLNPARALNYVLFRSGNTISSGVESTEGQFSYRNGIPVPAGSAAVRLVVDKNGVRYFLDDHLAETIPFPAGRRAGSGLIIEPASMWGNQVQEVTLSKFAATMEPGQSFFQTVNADAKAQALTVPRFRKEDLPRHALLAANGDLLRGEIEAVTNTQFGFRIGLETLRVPRDRVAAVVALQKPPDTLQGPDERSATLKLLERSVNQQTWYGAVNFSALIELVKEAVPELKFTLPEDDDTETAQYHFNNESVAETLDNLCEQFDLRYRVEQGAVVIEKKSAAGPDGMLRRPYWLKTDAFPGQEPVEDILAAKGIPFPGGASARWQATTRCLEVTNTAANQDKMAALLAREFGGVAVAPTHWLQLVNGGRIALAVEKFAPDAISGTHPVYGRCNIPLSEVYTIRNTLPDPSPAGPSVRDWRLAYAPEPVLPESGGDGSALLGKDAPTFKLALLAGGDFDLSQQQGRVVVLDFWATWCGPCIKSLPGLIETMARFPMEQVTFVGLNQAEAPAQVKRFLETRGWNLPVAMDAGQNVARQYGVDGIPHTVVVGPDGKVAWVRTGYSPDGDTAVAAAVEKLLAVVPTAPTDSGRQPGAAESIH